MNAVHMVCSRLTSWAVCGNSRTAKLCLFSKTNTEVWRERGGSLSVKRLALCPKKAKCSFYTCRFTQNASLLRVLWTDCWCDACPLDLKEILQNFPSWKSKQVCERNSSNILFLRVCESRWTRPKSHSRMSARLHGRYFFIPTEGTVSGVYMNPGKHPERLLFRIPPSRLFLVNTAPLPRERGVYSPCGFSGEPVEAGYEQFGCDGILGTLCNTKMVLPVRQLWPLTLREFISAWFPWLQIREK